MKKMFLFWAVLSLVAVANAQSQTNLIVRIHFAGTEKISADPNHVAFVDEFCSAEALALRKQTADKLSPWLAGWFQKNLNATVPDGAAKLRPLLDDLQKSEWFLEARTGANGKPLMAMAVKLVAARANLWQTTIHTFFAY